MITSIPNGGITIFQSDYPIGTTLSYFCLAGFATRPSVIIETVCLGDFTWSLDTNPPECLRSKLRISWESFV